VVVDTDDWEGPGGWNDQGDYGRWLQRFFTWQERWGLRHADAVTVASRALQTLVWSLGSASPDADARGRVFYLPNGVSSEPPALPTNSGARSTVLLYTRFFEYDLTRLWRIMRAVRVRRDEVRFLVVGKGFDREEERLMKLARRAGWHVISDAAGDLDETYCVPDADLIYAGWGTPEKLRACFSAADLGIYPFDDTLLNRTKCPMKVMDQLAAGIPVVADAVGQLSEIVVHEKSGLLIRHSDAAAFVDAILALLADRGRLTRMASAARDDVVTRFAWDRLASTAEAAYAYALSRH
jgi:glycosyltransferase involved in cell wall biosynthesis